ADDTRPLTLFLIQREAARHGLVILFDLGLALRRATEPCRSPGILYNLLELLVVARDLVNVRVAEFCCLLQQILLDLNQQILDGLYSAVTRDELLARLAGNITS